MNQPQTSDVLVIGGGISGLACARELKRNGIHATVLDRARGVGGRCASKTLHGQRIDYGVPYLHGSSSHFLGFLEGLLTSAPDVEVISGWPLRVRHPHLACQPIAFEADQRRLAVAPGVSMFPKLMAQDLDVRLGVPIQFLSPVSGAVEAVATDGRRFRAARIVLALAVPQALRLLEPIELRVAGGREIIQRLAAVDCLPCLTVIAGYDLRVPVPPWDIDFPRDTTILHSISHDSGKRRDPEQRVFVYQARPHYSRSFLNAPEGVWTADILWEAGEALGNWAAHPAWTYGHCWSWARLHPNDPGLGDSFWVNVDGGGAIGLCGEAFGEAAGVEGAFLSGVGLARRLVEAGG